MMTSAQIQKLREEREELRQQLERATRIIWSIEKGFCWVCGSRSSKGHLCSACESAGYDPNRPPQIRKARLTYWHHACPYYIGAYVSSHLFGGFLPHWYQHLLVVLVVASMIHLLVSYRLRED